MVAETNRSAPVAAKKPNRPVRLAFLSRIFLRIRRLLGHYVFSSLTRRILVLNLAGLAVMVSGILYINQFRRG